MRCNLRCQHCYIPPERRASRRDPELSLAEIKRILDEVTDAGCLWLLLTGGEPLLRKDFLDVYSYAKHKGLILTIFTNGTLLTPRIADYLAEWRPFNVEITLYGATQETYERVTGIPGSYACCRRGIDLLLDRNVPLGLKTMVMTLNHHELDEMKSLAAELGVKFRIDGIINPALDGSDRPIFFRLTPEEIVALDKADPERARLWQDQLQKNQVIPQSDQRILHCGAGKQGFHIDASGQLSICQTIRKPAYNLLSGSFREGWDQFLPKLIARQFDDDFPCLSCDLRFVCAQCPAEVELMPGETEMQDIFMCQVTKLRQVAFAKQI